MKKINVLIIAVIAIAAAFMTSCKNDTNNPLTTAAPVITFENGNQTVMTNSDVAISGNIYAAGEIKQIVYFKDDVSYGDAVTSGFDTDTTTYFSMSIPASEVTETFTFEIQVTDKNDKIGKGSVTITVQQGNPVDKTSSPIQLYSAPSTQTGNVPTFTSLTPDFTTYYWSTASGNEATIDMMYYNGHYNKSASNAPHFVSANVTTAFTYGGEALSGNNTTVFKILEGNELSNLGDWDSINDDENIVTIDMTNATTNVGEITDNDGNLFGADSIIAFKLSNGKMGLIKVISLVDGNNNGVYYDANEDYITFDVIVQEQAPVK